MTKRELLEFLTSFDDDDVELPVWSESSGAWVRGYLNPEYRPDIKGKDRDGYPTEEALQRIREWPYTDAKGLLDYVQSLWLYPGYFRQRGNTYRIATAGWSGHEEIIEALQENYMFWMMHWHLSRRGGMFVFEVPVNRSERL